MKNPFKTKSIVDTITNVAIGGAANVAMDYIVENVATLKEWLGGENASTGNIVKIIAGAAVGSMVSNRYARAAADGLATVGAADLMKSYITSDSTDGGGDTAAPAGAPFIGRPGIRMGQQGFRNAKGAGSVAFMQ